MFHSNSVDHLNLILGLMCSISYPCLLVYSFFTNAIDFFAITVLAVFSFDDMDGHIFQNGSDLQLTSSNVQGNYNYVSYGAENAFTQQHLVKPEDYDNYSRPQMSGYQHLAPSYVDYL